MQLAHRWRLRWCVHRTDINAGARCPNTVGVFGGMLLHTAEIPSLRTMRDSIDTDEAQLIVIAEDANRQQLNIQAEADAGN